MLIHNGTLPNGTITKRYVYTVLQNRTALQNGTWFKTVRGLKGYITKGTIIKRYMFQSSALLQNGIVKKIYVAEQYIIVSVRCRMDWLFRKPNLT